MISKIWEIPTFLPPTQLHPSPTPLPLTPLKEHLFLNGELQFILKEEAK